MERDKRPVRVVRIVTYIKEHPISEPLYHKIGDPVSDLTKPPRYELFRRKIYPNGGSELEHLGYSSRPILPPGLLEENWQLIKGSSSE